MPMSNFKSAIDCLREKLIELIDIHTLLNLCRNYKPSEKCRDFTMSDLEEDCILTCQQARMLIQLCKRISQYCDDNSQCNINAQMQILRQKMSEYNNRVKNLKEKLANFAYQLETDIDRARKVISRRDNAMIGQGAGFTGGVAAAIAGCVIGGPPGLVVAVGSIAWSSYRAKQGLQAYSACKHVVQDKCTNEELLTDIRVKYQELNKKNCEVKRRFATCEDQLASC